MYEMSVCDCNSVAQKWVVVGRRVKNEKNIAKAGKSVIETHDCAVLLPLALPPDLPPVILKDFG